MFMKANHLLPIAAFCLMTASCNTGKQQAELTAGIQLANLDTTALPGTDFYQYACGGWMKNNPIPAEYSQYGSFTILAENNRKQIQGLIEELAATQHEAGSVAQKIGDLYKIVMDSVKLNKDGVAPIKAELDQLAALKDKKELYALLGDMQKKGIIAYNVLYVGADEMNSSMNAVQTYQTGLSMGEREYYLENDEATAKIRDAFRTHVQKMYQLAGFDEATAKKGMEVVMDVETRLAKAFRSRTELRDPHANYNKMSMEELKKNYPTFDWDAYLSALDLKDVQEVIVGQPASLKAAAEILDTLPLEQQGLYLQWKLIDAAAGSERCYGRTELRLLQPHHERYTRDAAPLEESGKHCKQRAGRSCRSDVRGEIFPCCSQGAYGDFGEELAGKPGRTYQESCLDG